MKNRMYLEAYHAYKKCYMYSRKEEIDDLYKNLAVCGSGNALYYMGHKEKALKIYESVIPILNDSPIVISIYEGICSQLGKIF